MYSATKSSSECGVINRTIYVHQNDNDDYYYNVDADDDK